MKIDDDYLQTIKTFVDENPSQINNIDNIMCIDWLFMYRLIALYAAEQTKDSLINYLITVDAVFPSVNKIITKYYKTCIKELKNTNKLSKDELSDRHNREVELLKQNITALNIQIKTKNKLLTGVFQQGTKYKDYIESNYEIETDRGYKKPNKSFKDILDKIDIELAQTQRLSSINYEINTDVANKYLAISSATPDMPVINILYTGNSKDTVLYTDFYNACNGKLPVNIQKSIINTLLPGCNGTPKKIPYLKFFDPDNIVEATAVPSNGPNVEQKYDSINIAQSSNNINNDIDASIELDNSELNF